MQARGVEVHLVNSQQSHVFSPGALLESFSSNRKREGGKVVTTIQIVVIEAEDLVKRQISSRKAARNNQRSDLYFAKRKAQLDRLCSDDQSPTVKMTQTFGSTSIYRPKSDFEAGTVQNVSRDAEIVGHGVVTTDSAQAGDKSSSSAELTSISSDEANAVPSDTEESKRVLSFEQKTISDHRRRLFGWSRRLRKCNPKTNAKK